MDDLLSEDDQWEAVKRWLKENGAWIIGGVILGGGGLLGYRWYEARLTARSQDASAQYTQLQTALAENKEPRVQELASGLKDEFAHTPYADHAQLALVRTEVERGEFDKAAERLNAVIKDSDDEYLQQVARVRLARVQLAQNKADDALATLDKVKSGAFSGLANETRGDVLLAKGDRKGALDSYKAALLDTGSGVGTEGGSLQLKINDLAASAPAAAAEAVKEEKK